MSNPYRILLAAILSPLCLQGHHTGDLWVERGPLRIIPDYSMDSSGFFTNDKRAVVQWVFQHFEAHVHTPVAGLGAYGGNTWNWVLQHPGTGASQTLSNPTAYNDVLIIYLGARDLGSTTLGKGGPVGWSARGTSEFLDRVHARNTDTRYFPWAGIIAINSTTNWYIPAHPYDPQPFPGKVDLFATLAHELCHVLGIGNSQPELWDILTNGGYFRGPQSLEVFNGPVPIDGAHWAANTTSIVWSYAEVSQTALMTSTATAGQRRYPTDLEWAALADLGNTVWDFPQTLLWYAKSGPLPDLLGDVIVSDGTLQLEILSPSQPTDLWVQNLDKPLDQAFYRPISELVKDQPNYYTLSTRLTNGTYRIHLYAEEAALIRASDGKGDQPHVLANDWQGTQSFGWHPRAGYYFMASWPWVYFIQSNQWAYSVAHKGHTYLYLPSRGDWFYTNDQLVPWIQSVTTRQWASL